MIRGLYTATSGMLTSNRKIDVTANNIANISTAGFKRDSLVATVFDEALVSRMENGTVTIGNSSQRTIAGEIGTDLTQGSLKETGNSLDLAVKGDGFFTLTNAQGQQWFSRNGQFSMDAEGYLTLPQGGRLMGENGAVKVDGTGFTVNGQGEVYDTKGKLVDKLLIYSPTGNTMVKQSEGMFVDMAYTQANFIDDGEVLQGVLESSNVDMTEELSDMISSQRSFQACSQALKMIDSTLQKAVNEVGRI